MLSQGGNLADACPSDDIPIYNLFLCYNMFVQSLVSLDLLLIMILHPWPKKSLRRTRSSLLKSPFQSLHLVDQQH